jgi:hypothetical protein
MPGAQPPASGADPHEVLLKRIQDFMDASNQLQTQQTMDQQELEASKAETVAKAIEILKSAGVNPADPRSIANYLQKLEEQEPDMAQLIKQALYGIFGGAPQDSQAQSSSMQPEASAEPTF